MITSYITSGVAGLFAGYLAVSAVITDPPPVELLSLSYDVKADAVRYERRVHVSEKIRGQWTTALVDRATERSLPGCDASGSADYGPNEPEVQQFSADELSRGGCKALMVPSAEYEWVITVIPPFGKPDQIRSEPFTVHP